MDNNRELKTPKKNQLFHFDDHHFEKICASLENEIENLKVVRNQNQTPKTSNDQHFKAALYETKTIPLLKLPSLAPSIKTTLNTQKEIKESSKYLLSATVQTSRSFQRTQHTQTEPISLKDQSNIISVWMLQNEIVNNSFVKKQDNERNDLKKTLFIFDRIVTSNNFSKNQIEFIMRQPTDKLNATSYRYKIDEILQFSIDKLVNFAITSFAWNSANETIFAVGYGKWNDESHGCNKGAVCCWSLKNPMYPERIYEFDHPITCLDFSKTNANILVAGSYGGYIYTLDISRDICIPVVINEKYLQNFPIWSVVSFFQKSYTSEDEFILSADSNGSVRKYSTVDKTYKSEQFSLIHCGIRRDAGAAVKTDGTKCGVPTVVQNMCGTTVSFHPVRGRAYFVGTNVGYLVQNTVDGYGRYDNMFLAHDGPVYGVKFSPYCPTVFATYGADWKIKIWMENIEPPLLSLCYTNAVADADWSPKHSTVIASVGGSVICIWDFARKTVEPVMTFTCGTGVRFSMVRFSRHGNNIITGDVNGLVRCFHISSMPSPSFLQKNSILTALENIMPSNKELVQLIKKEKNGH